MNKIYDGEEDIIYGTDGMRITYKLGYGNKKGHVFSQGKKFHAENYMR